MTKISLSLLGLIVVPETKIVVKEEIVRGPERLGGQLTRLREVIGSILALAEELKSDTIESVLAKSDIDMALEVLSGKRKL